MDIQALLAQLQGMNLLGESAQFGDLYNLTGEQIAGGLGSLYDSNGS